MMQSTTIPILLWAIIIPLLLALAGIAWGLLFTLIRDFRWFIRALRPTRDVEVAKQAPVVDERPPQHEEYGWTPLCQESVQDTHGVWGPCRLDKGHDGKHRPEF